MLWLISKRSHFSSSYWKHEGIFLQYTLWDRASRAPGGKTHKSLGAPLWLDSQSFSLSDLSTLSLQEIVNYSSGFRAPALVGWCSLMCQCWFISCNKCTSLVGVLITGYACAGAGSILEISVLYAQFCCKSKIVFKNKTFFCKRLWKKSKEGQKI